MIDIIGSPLAIEALAAYFLESTFMELWFFGRNKITAKLRAFSIWMVGGRKHAEHEDHADRDKCFCPDCDRLSGMAVSHL